MAIPTGKRLGPYEILSAVGAGGMGEVYRAKDSRLDRVVAIKVLSAHVAESDSLRERFMKIPGGREPAPSLWLRLPILSVS